MNTTGVPTISTIPKVPGDIPDAFLAMLRDHGVIRAWLFGSAARGEAHVDSDLDLLVTFDHPVHMFDELRLARKLGELIGRRVDLMTDIHPAFARYIEPTLVSLPL